MVINGQAFIAALSLAVDFTVTSTDSEMVPKVCDK